jgi:sugar phosphate permease
MKNKFPYRYRLLVFLFFLTLITYLDRVCISLVGVRMKTEFNLSNEQFGLVQGAFALAYALFEIPSGALGDRIGQRAVLIRIVLWWSLFTALTGATTGLLSLIAVRFLFGMGESGAYPTSSAVISRWFPAGETARSMSSLFVGQNAGAAIAPLIVIPIAASFGWRASFLVNGFIGLIWVFICFLWFTNNPSETKGISGEERMFIESTRRFIDHKRSFPWKVAVKSRSLHALVISLFCSQWAQYFFVAWMPIYLQEGRHFSEDDVKMITAYFFLMGIIGVLIAGFLSDRLVRTKGLRFSRRFLGALPLCLMALSFSITARTPDNTVVLAGLYISQLLYSFNPIVSYSTCVDIGGNCVGTVAGIMNFFGQAGAFCLAIAFGKIADTTHSFSTPLFLVAAVVFVGSICWLFVDPTQQVTEKGAGD